MLENMGELMGAEDEKERKKLEVKEVPSPMPAAEMSKLLAAPVLPWTAAEPELMAELATFHAHR